MTHLMTTDLVRLGADWGTEKEHVIRALAGVVAEAGRASDVERLAGDALARERAFPTGLPQGVAIPHCRSAAVEVPSLAFARLDSTVDFGAKDGPADLVFLIAAPETGERDHVAILAQLARALVRRDFIEGLRAARTADEVVGLVARSIGEPVPEKASPATGAPPGTAAGDAATATSASADDARPTD